MVFSGQDSILGIAELTESRHYYDRNLSRNKIFFDHIRRVRWLMEREYTSRLKLGKPVRGFSCTLSKVTPGSPRWQLLIDIEM